MHAVQQLSSAFLVKQQFMYTSDLVEAADCRLHNMFVVLSQGSACLHSLFVWLSYSSACLHNLFVLCPRILNGCQS